MIELELAAASRAAHALGVSINDVVLASVGEGARAAFAALGAAVPAVLPASVPVLLPAGDGRTNQVAAFTARIPLADVGPARRARMLAPMTRVRAADARGRPLPWFVRTPAGARLMRRYVARQRVIGLLSTNVRGPAESRLLCGAPVERVWALPVLAGTVRVGVAAVSYAGALNVCLLWADELAEAGERMADTAEAAFASLLAHA
ncbi:WS/DGAT domain-containing protein [Demequina silvatica]|uniref:WS/DGAT domain-containing protein n=1 Tax=Demequina silvatica TaxID=1638988 RepID=UPI000A6B1D6C|nr:WS/DGAT domain-containing protein [Demequina silvatica]